MYATLIIYCTGFTGKLSFWNGKIQLVQCKEEHTSQVCLRKFVLSSRKYFWILNLWLSTFSDKFPTFYTITVLNGCPLCNQYTCTSTHVFELHIFSILHVRKAHGGRQYFKISAETETKNKSRKACPGYTSKLYMNVMFTYDVLT